jgi:hypothetical protein
VQIQFQHLFAKTDPHVRYIEIMGRENQPHTLVLTIEMQKLEKKKIRISTPNLVSKVLY